MSQPTPEKNEKRIEELEGHLRLALRAMLVAGVIFISAAAATAILLSGAITDNEDAIDQIQVERSARIDTVAGIIDQNCSTNNAQDRLLARLLRVSANPDAGGFGAGVDLSTLSSFDLQVLGSIAKVQELTAEGPPNRLQRVFNAKRKELEALTPCQQLVARYLAGEPVPRRAGQ